jgi:hypothetical protein
MMSGIRPSYYGIFNDVPEYWEWSGEAAVPVRPDERRLQAGRELLDLRDDPLRSG